LERIACHFNAVSGTSGENVITLLALKGTRKLKKKNMADNRELEFTKDWLNTRKKKKISSLFERETCPTHVSKKVLLR
jgi:hypothetical protein